MVHTPRKVTIVRYFPWLGVSCAAKKRLARGRVESIPIGSACGLSPRPGKSDDGPISHPREREIPSLSSPFSTLPLREYAFAFARNGAHCGRRGIKRFHRESRPRASRVASRCIASRRRERMQRRLGRIGNVPFFDPFFPRCHSHVLSSGDDERRQRVNSPLVDRTGARLENLVVSSVSQSRKVNLNVP